MTGRPPLRLAPPPGETEQHRPVCGRCGESWPCAEQRSNARLRAIESRLSDLCWACGKPAKSALGFGVLSPRGGIVLSRWCGPAKRRRCDAVGWLYREADLRHRAVQAVP